MQVSILGSYGRWGDGVPDEGNHMRGAGCNNSNNDNNSDKNNNSNNSIGTVKCGTSLFAYFQNSI